MGVTAPPKIFAQSTATTADALAGQQVASSKPGGVLPICSAS